MITIENINILVVEDNEMNFAVLSAFLEEYPCNIIHAWDGVQAIKEFKKLRPHFILMDVAMPNMDGITATKAIRNLETQYRLKRTPISAFTAYVTSDERKACFDAGMDFFYEKPVERERFKSFFEHAIPGMKKLDNSFA